MFPDYISMVIPTPQNRATFASKPRSRTRAYLSSSRLAHRNATAQRLQAEPRSKQGEREASRLQERERHTQSSSPEGESELEAEGEERRQGVGGFK
jgi:hypothetical protein